MNYHPGTAVRYYFRVGVILSRHLSLLLASSPLLSGLRRPARIFFWRLFTASFWGLPPEKPCNTMSPGHDRPGASPFLRYRGSIAVALYRTPRYVPPRRTSNNSCWDLAPGSLPLCGQSQGCRSTGSSPFSCAPYRIPTQSSCKWP